jgi:hypothetical protein
MSWLPIDDGTTIGTCGSEGGVIILDEEHSFGARVTLERGGGTAPWSVTCGVYGDFMHTAFASSEIEGRKKYLDMKVDLEKIMTEENEEERYRKMRLFVDIY